MQVRKDGSLSPLKGSEVKCKNPDCKNVFYGRTHPDGSIKRFCSKKCMMDYNAMADIDAGYQRFFSRNKLRPDGSRSDEPRVLPVVDCRPLRGFGPGGCYVDGGAWSYADHMNTWLGSFSVRDARSQVERRRADTD